MDRRNIYKQGCLDYYNMFWFFGKKKEVEKLRGEVRDSFAHVKKDFGKVGQWITHIDGEMSKSKADISEIKDTVSAIQNDLEEIKDFVSFFGPQMSKQLFKQEPTGVYEQTAVEAVQTPVQTAVQTGILSGLTVMERAIVWALLNSEMKLSYEDIARLLGKEKSTIRGQINMIKQKSEGLIEESSELNGKKRLFIPEKMRNILLKSVKVSVRNKKNQKKRKNNDNF